MAAEYVNIGGYMLPKILASDLGYYETQNDPFGDIGANWISDDYRYKTDEFGNRLENVTGDFNNPTWMPWQKPDPSRVYQLSGGDYGMFNSNDRNGMSSWSNNMQISGLSPTEFELMVKSADKEGTKYKYELRDGYWIPVAQMGTQGWDTNHMDPADLLRAASVVAMPFAAEAAFGNLLGGGGAAAGAAGASPGTMTTYGLLDTSVALPGTQFAPFVGAAPPALNTYGILDKSVALPGTQFVDAIGGSGLSGLLSGTSPNTLLKAAGLLGGALAGSATGQPNGVGGPTPATQQPVPQMYGGGGIPQFQTYGPTQTEKYMTQQYLPGLFGNQSMAKTQPYSRSLLGDY